MSTLEMLERVIAGNAKAERRRMHEKGASITSMLLVTALVGLWFLVHP